MSNSSASISVVVNNYRTGDVLNTYREPDSRFWVEADGRTLSKSDYQDLFTLIGHAYLLPSDFDETGNNILESQNLFRLPSRQTRSLDINGYWNEKTENVNLSIVLPESQHLCAIGAQVPKGYYYISNVVNTDFQFLNGKKIYIDGLVNLFDALILEDKKENIENLNLILKHQDIVNYLLSSHEIFKITIPDTLDKIILDHEILNIGEKYRFDKIEDQGINQLTGHVLTATSTTELVPDNVAFLDTSGTFEYSAYRLIEGITIPLSESLPHPVETTINIPSIPQLKNIGIEGIGIGEVIKSGLENTELAFLLNQPIRQYSLKELLQNGISQNLAFSGSVTYDSFNPSVTTFPLLRQFIHL